MQHFAVWDAVNVTGIYCPAANTQKACIQYQWGKKREKRDPEPKDAQWFVSG